MKLRDYQGLMVKHEMAVPRCNVWARMGTGKTMATLVYLDFLHNVLGQRDQSLVLAPRRVAAATWPDEVAKWDAFRYLDVGAAVGTLEERRQVLREKHQVVTINYEQLPWLVKFYGKHWPFRNVIADESTRLKGFRLRQGGVRAQALAKVAHRLVERWVNLTGTPSPNGLVDLWGQTWFLDKGDRLGLTYEAFKRRWFYPERAGDNAHAVTQVPLPHAQKEIEAALADITITVDFPGRKEPIVQVLPCVLPPDCRTKYRELERAFFTQLRDGEKVEVFNAASLSSKCLQMANGAVYVEGGGWAALHDAKLEVLDSVIEEAAGAPVLVAYHFRSDLARLRKAYPQGRVLDDNPQTVRDWNAGRIPILFIHPASAGHGLNLQDGGNIIAFYGLWWNLEEHQQVIERIGPTRQAQSGYDRPVYVYYIVTRGTVDDLVLQRLATKASVQDVLLEAMKDRLR